MKKVIFITLVLAWVIYLIGCGKKQELLEEMQEPLSMDELSRVNIPSQTVSETKTQITPTAPAGTTELEPLPPAGPYKPSTKEIQTALKNAGFYIGAIDGKVGPLTKQAIEDFQKANGLKVDGKVGPKTWAVLSIQLNPPVESKPKKR